MAGSVPTPGNRCRAPALRAACCRPPPHTGAAEGRGQGPNGRRSAVRCNERGCEMLSWATTMPSRGPSSTHYGRAEVSAPLALQPCNQEWQPLQSGAHNVVQDLAVLGEPIGVLVEEARQVNAVAAAAGMPGGGWERVRGGWPRCCCCCCCRLSCLSCLSCLGEMACGSATSSAVRHTILSQSVVDDVGAREAALWGWDGGGG